MDMLQNMFFHPMNQPTKFPKALRGVFNALTKDLSRGEKEGLGHTLKLILKRRKLFSILIISSVIAALFEGGTIGLLGLAVSVLVGEQSNAIGEAVGGLSPRIDLYLHTISPAGLFLGLVGIAIIVQILKSMLLYVSQAAQIYLSTALRIEVQEEVVSQMMSMSYSQVSTYPRGSLASFIEQAASAQDLVDLSSNVTRATLMLLAYGSLMLWVSPIMSLASLIAVSILWMILTTVVKRIKRLSFQATNAKVFLWRWTIEFLNAPRLLRIFNSTDSARDIIKKARDSELIPERNATIIDAAIKPTLEVFAIFGAGVFLIVGYLLAGDGAAAAIPELFVFVLVFYRLKPQIQAFSDIRVKLARIFPKLELVSVFLRHDDKDYDQLGGESFSRLKRDIVFRKVGFRYPNSGKSALDDISFSVKRGETVALVGSSGAGKSTITDLLLGLYKPTAGSIIVDGCTLSKLNIRDWREHIGVVDQEVFLLNASVKENICFGRQYISLDEIKKAAQAAFADEFIETLKDGYDTIIGERGHMLSGGQQQRVALARALYGNPDILILDEATSALDTMAERLIQRALEEMHNDRTILVVAHRLSTIANADQIVVIESGKIIEKGGKDALLSRGGKFSEIWNLQQIEAGLGLE